MRFVRKLFSWKPILAISCLAGVLYGQAATSGSVTCGAISVPTSRMPVSGPNFSSYCIPCIAALRTYAREPVIDTLVAGFAQLENSRPKVKFLYGEIGFPDGGRFRPHRTHREGLSVDLMVPLADRKVMSTSAANRYGYDVDFTDKGTNEQGQVDFAALADLIVSLKKQAQIRGGDIRRIFFAPDLQPLLKKYQTEQLSGIRFNKKQSWVRHDDHIHVDFEFGCPG